jgi:hypothetical protein
MVRLIGSPRYVLCTHRRAAGLYWISPSALEKWPHSLAKTLAGIRAPT